MKCRSKIALLCIGIIVVLMMVAEIAKPKAINWRDSYSAVDKIPLGCFVIYNELKLVHSGTKSSTQTIYNYLKKYNDSIKSNLVFINNTIRFDEEETKSLLTFVNNGNTVFISASSIWGSLADTLNILTRKNYTDFRKVDVTNRFTNKQLKSYKHTYKDVIENSYIKSFDTLNTSVLGKTATKDSTYVNYIKTSFGNNNGAFYIHTNPFAFSNYHMLNKGDLYASAVLSYLPKTQYIWDNYYKTGRKIVTSPIRFILTNKSLKWALYITLMALLLFTLFKSKRTQRVIPVIKPLNNATVDFTQTIADLYFQEKQYKSIINKKNTYFFNYVKTHFYLDTNTINEAFIKKLAVKSNNTFESTKSLIDFIQLLKSKTTHTQQNLIDLNKKLEAFLKT